MTKLPLLLSGNYWITRLSMQARDHKWGEIQQNQPRHSLFLFHSTASSKLGQCSENKKPDRKSDRVDFVVGTTGFEPVTPCL